MSIYVEDDMEVHQSILGQDFDAVGYEPVEEVGDDDEEMAELFGY